MFMMDMIDTTQDSPSVVLVSQAEQRQNNAENPERTIGGCYKIDGYTVEFSDGIKAVNSLGMGYQYDEVDMYGFTEECPNGHFWKIASDGQITPLKRELKDHEKDEDRGSIESFIQNTQVTTN